MFDIPILLITFNRPDHVRRVLDEIKKQQPKELYVAQDGAREGNENDRIKVLEVRSVVEEMVDWPCDLHTLYQEKNLGCGPGPYAAISWFFTQVDCGIILEDDISPHPLFWEYMSDLLLRYKDDDRVGMVTAHNLRREYYGNRSYYFTPVMAGTLGWGTWKRVWKDFKFDIEYDKHEFELALKRYFHIPWTLRLRLHRFQNRVLKYNRHDCWDYQWDYFLSVNGYLNARPNSCLTSHLGNAGDGTHQYFNNNYLMEVNESLFQTIRHPSKVCISKILYLNMWVRAIRALPKEMSILLGCKN